MTTRIEGGGEKILLTLAIEAVETSPATRTGWLVRVNALMDGWMGSSQIAGGGWDPNACNRPTYPMIDGRAPVSNQ